MQIIMDSFFLLIRLYKYKKYIKLYINMVKYLDIKFH